MYKLFVMLRIGICPIGSLIMPESGVNLRGLVPGTRVDWIGKLLKMANNLGLDPFPDPIGHFGGSWQPFWILQVVRRCRR